MHGGFILHPEAHTGECGATEAALPNLVCGSQLTSSYMPNGVHGYTFDPSPSYIPRGIRV
jgi:hypothetical protein